MDLRPAIVIAVFGVCAVGLGGVLTKLVFRSVDRHDGVAAAAARAEATADQCEGTSADAGQGFVSRPRLSGSPDVDVGDHAASEAPAAGGAFAHGSVTGAGSVLRGGAWIGALERLAIYAGLVAGWPDVIAIVLAVKGLGRYPELRSGDTPAVAERFIIGTFVSVLWACGCAGLAIRLRG